MIEMEKVRSVHIVGIGGSGTGSVGRVLLDMGYRVSGSDIRESVNTIRLRDLGAQIYINHRAENIRNTDIVVCSSAISRDNPEIIEAMRIQLPVVRRAEMLSWIMSQSTTSIAIAGTHGKTTTTAMTSLIFDKCALNPTFLIGGESNDVGGNSRLGDGRYCIAEADESDESFLCLRPNIGVITNIDADHLDYFGNTSNYFKAFLRFAGLLHSEGSLIAFKDDPNIRDLLLSVGHDSRVVTYGFGEDAQLQARNMLFTQNRSEYEVYSNGDILGICRLNVPGRHNIANSLASICCGLEAGLEFQQAADALSYFSGVNRRFQLTGRSGGILIYDDFGHHPTEIATTLKAVRSNFPDIKRLICVFQPHRFSRTMHLSREFGSCFTEADKVILTDIYSAGEEPIQGISGKTILGEIQKNGHPDVVYISNKADIPDHLLGIVEDGDLVLTIGAGDIHKVGKDFYALLTGQTL